MGADPNHGAELAQRILRAFRNDDWNTLLPGLKVTCSIGVAILHPGQSGGEAETVLGRLMAEADRGLYMAKQEGRNTFRVGRGEPAAQAGRWHAHADTQAERRTGSRIIDDLQLEVGDPAVAGLPRSGSTGADPR